MENLHEELKAVEDYTSVLEEALVALCEELEIDPQELVEDIMTVGRARQLGGAVNKQAVKTRRAYEADERNPKRKTYAGHEKSRTKTAKRFQKELKKSKALGRRFDYENESPRVFGMGGKVVPKGARHRTTDVDTGHYGSGRQRSQGGGFQDAR